MTSSLNNPVSVFEASSAILKDVFTVKSVVVGGETYMITGGADGMSVLRFDPDLGTLTKTEEIFDGGTDASLNTIDFLKDVKDLDIVQEGGKTFVLAAATEGALNVFSLSSGGELTLVDLDSQNDGTESSALNNLNGVATATVNGTTYVYTGGDGDAVEVYTMNTTTGAITYDASLSVADDNGTDGLSNDVANLGNIKSIDTVSTGGKTFVAVGTGGDDAITLFEVAANGNLTSVDVEHHGTIETGSTIENNVNNPGDLAFASVGSKTFLISSEAEGSGAIQVFELDATNGTLTNVFSIADGGLDAASNTVTLIRDIESLSVVENAFGTFIFAVSEADDSATVFKLDSGGGLTLDSQTIDDPSTAYDQSFAGHHFIADDGSTYYAQGGGEGVTVSQFVPCFASGTRILTERGAVTVEELVRGDRVLTADRGLLPICWIGRRHLSFTSGSRRHKPILIPVGALGEGLPVRDLVVSPQHRMSLSIDGDEHLVPAKALIGKSGIRQMHGKRSVIYHHLLFDTHQVIFAEGAPTESFLPRDYTLHQMPYNEREEILGIFPELRRSNATAAHPARPILRFQKARRYFAETKRQPVAACQRQQKVSEPA